MQRVIGVCLFTFLSFLIWLYVATDQSTIDNWWTVLKAREMNSGISDVVIISEIYYISAVKVLIGLATFIVIGTLLSLIVMKRKNGVRNSSLL